MPSSRDLFSEVIHLRGRKKAAKKAVPVLAIGGNDHPGDAQAETVFSFISDPLSHQTFPRDHLVKPDLLVECADSSANGGHQHLVHSFPLYLMGAYWHKAILFANQDPVRRPLIDMRRLKLPFGCEAVQELINFAYDGVLSDSVTGENIKSMYTAADYTMSTRMMAALAQLEKRLLAPPSDIEEGQPAEESKPDNNIEQNSKPEDQDFPITEQN